MADDQQTPMEIDLTEETQDGAAAAVPLSPLPLNLLVTIKTAQAQNGLRHGDYMRYRKHCTSRLQSLYKVLKMQHGRTKYQKRKLDVHSITDVRHLHVVLFSSERAWAQAMEMKKEAAASGSGGALDPRKRHHLIGRIAKAVLWASELSRLSAARSDTRGSLEAEAYSCWLGGSLLLERETDWETALGKFNRAKKLWQELAKACPDAEGQSLCLAQVEEVEPNIRYCNYRIARAGGEGGAAPPNPSELLSARDEEGAGGDLLQSKLAALAAEAQRVAAASTSYFEWLGGRHPVRQERVRLALHQANELGAAADKVMDVDSEALDARLALYDKSINALSEAKSYVRNAVRGLASPDSETQFRELESLEAAVEGARLVRALQRTEVALGAMRSRFGAGLGRLAVGKKIKDKERHARPEEVVRSLEVLGRHLEDLTELGARLGGRAGEGLHDAAMAKLSATRALGTYHVAHAFLAAAITNTDMDPAANTTSTSGSSKALEAWALFDRAQERAAAAAGALRALSEGDAATAVLLGAREPPCRDLEEVGRQAASYKAVAQAELFARQLEASEDVHAGLTSLSLNADTNTPAPYLLDALDTWGSFACGAPPATSATPRAAAPTTAVGGSKAPPRLYRDPYPFAAIPMRPIMLDTASSALAYPPVGHRLRKEERKSVLSSLFGWRR